MRLDTAFRLSTFCTLVLASWCLAYAEEAFLPGILNLILPVGFLLAVAFIIEERWNISLYASNILGMFIAAGAAAWIAYQLLQPNNAVAERVPRSAVPLPYLGPVLMVLMLAIMFRSKKVHDFWWLHTVGLLEVILACVMGSEPFFGLLLFLYMTCVLWSLSLYYLHREQRRAARRERARGAEAVQVPTRALAWQACRWACVVSALAMALFLLMPRMGDAQWDPFTLSSNLMTTGYSDGMNLNRAGQLRVSDRVAFEVTVTDAEQAPTRSLTPDQRWRGAVLDQYERGQWHSRSVEIAPRGAFFQNRPRPPRPPDQLPNLGAGQLFFTFTVDARRANGLFLAEPAARALWIGRRLLPVMSLDPNVSAVDLFHVDSDGSLLPVVPRPATYHYRQALVPVPEAGVSPPVRSDDPTERQYCAQPVRGIREWTAELLQRLQVQGKLDAADFVVLRGSPWVYAEKRQKVARIMANHFAFSGQFGYSLNLRRADPKLDPTEDFLRNVKQGHCERFASGLALVLRSCGIPARVVVGFRGAEPRLVDGQNVGRYVIRQSHAHSWVEALVQRQHPGMGDTWHWLTLDPTPAEEVEIASDSWWSLGWLEFLRNTGSAWQNFILDYNTERRGETAEAISGQLGVGGLREWISGWIDAARQAGKSKAELAAWALIPVLLLGCVWLSRGRLRAALRWVRQQPAPETASTAFSLACHRRLLALLRQHLGLEPRPVQTPLEFAGQAGDSLRRQSAAATLADVPLQVVRLLYRARYGNRPPAAVEDAAIAGQLDALEAFLRERPAAALPG